MNRTRTMFFAIMFLAIGQGTTAWAQSSDTVFAEANARYREGAFDAAARQYETLVQRGVVNATVFYNLGNAYYRLGRVSKAILFYERAFGLEPTNADIQHNLRLARLRTVDRIEPVPELFLIGWVRSLNEALPLSFTTIVSLAGWTLTFLSLMFIYLGRGSFVVRAGRPFFFSGVLLATIFGILLFLQTSVVPEHENAIIMVPTVTAKSSPDTEGTDAFVVHEGLNVRVSDALEGWVRITLADGKTGWVRTGEIERI